MSSRLSSFFGCILLVFITFGLSLSYIGEPLPHAAPPQHLRPPSEVTHPWKYDRDYNGKDYVLGDPKPRFRDNLRNDTKYITTWAPGGWTNDVLSMFNLIFLSLITSRIPILPSFAPSHFDHSAGHMPFSDIFDLPALSAALKKPILEWKDVKDEVGGEQDEPLGCWSVWGATGSHDGSPRMDIKGPEHSKLDLSFTLAPSSVRLKDETPGDPHATFWGVAALSSPTFSTPTSPAPFPSRGGHSLPPDDQLQCHDFLYWTVAHQPFEWEEAWSPPWHIVGKWAKWNTQVERTAKSYIRMVLEISSSAQIPPFVAVHIRRSDFKDSCVPPVDECVAPLAAYARRVLDVRNEILMKKAIDIPRQRVIFSTDEPMHSDWWTGRIHDFSSLGSERLRFLGLYDLGKARNNLTHFSLAELGWKYINHKDTKFRTTERFGLWYEVILDVAIQSYGLGFVGTSLSTLSLLGERRVNDWNGGIGRQVIWGWKGADNHT